MARQVLVWNEHRHEQVHDEVAAVYPDGIHSAIAAGLRERGHDVRTATLEEPEHGLTEVALEWADVVTWWGHMAHHEVDDEIVDRLTSSVLDGLGLIVLHSGHYSKPFTELMGTSCSLNWREDGETERIWTVEPGHPIAAGVDESFEIPRTEMYGERFDVPPPDALVFLSWFEGGEVFRSGCCYRRGAGRVFYFRPGHETYPIYYQDEVRQVLHNAVEWAGRAADADVEFGKVEEPPESLE